ncbi:ion channel [Salinicoccus siamensis]|uniref:Ion channel n=1 Tax=Salinicoccus siamensis TaxID=381830 RepID=A0ABV5Z263_9STAP
MISFFLTALRLLKAIGKALSRPAFKSLLFTLFVILLSGTLFYTSVEGWGVLDTIYFGVVSLIPSSVETGLTPVTNAGKIFTMMYLVVGVGVMVSMLGMIAKEVIDFKPEQNKGNDK